MRQAWRELVPANIRHRNGLTFACPPAPHVTHKVLQQFDEGLQVHLARVVVGALLSGAAQATWDRLQSPNCQFCGAVDTKHHRVLHCPATATARGPFLSLLQLLEMESPEWFHCPYPSTHESEPFLRLLWASRQTVAPPASMLNVPSLTCAGEIHFFTDGTCPEARHAAWAVLVYTGPWPFCPEWLQLQWKDRQGLAAFFSVVAQGVVPGLQTISRAEVLALCQAAWLAQSFPNGQATVWSDSQVARRELQLQLEVGIHFASDLIHAVPDRVFEGVRLRKIAAYKQVEDVPRDLVLPTIGNHLADEAAKAARNNDLNVARETCEAVAEHYHEQHARFLAYCQFQAELIKVAKPLRAAAKRESQINYQPDELNLEAVTARWNSLQTTAIDVATESAADRLCVQRANYPQALQMWCDLLVWPTGAQAAHGYVGITFLELMFNFIVCTGLVPLVGASRTHEGVDLLSAQGILQPVVLRELVVSFVTFVRWREKAEGRKFFDSLPHRRIYEAWSMSASARLGKD